MSRPICQYSWSISLFTASAARCCAARIRNFTSAIHAA
jgi:hypothetical protein